MNFKEWSEKYYPGEDQDTLHKMSHAWAGGHCNMAASGKTRSNIHLPNDLPDADICVMLLLLDSDYPVWPGFWDGAGWRQSDASPVDPDEVMGWIHIEDMANALIASLAATLSEQPHEIGLADSIQAAQVAAGEQAVIGNLDKLGL